MTADDKLDLILARLDRQESRFAQIDQRFDKIDKRFEQIDARFVQVDKRFEQAEQQRRDDRMEMLQRFSEIKDELKEVRYNSRMDSKKLDEVYDARNRVTVNFTRAFAIGNASIAVIVSVLTSFFMASKK